MLIMNSLFLIIFFWEISGYGTGPNNYNVAGNYTAQGTYNAQGTNDNTQGTRTAGQSQGYHPYRR